MKPHANRVRIILSTAVISIITIAGSAARAQSNPYHLVENWAKLPPGRKFGAVIGVAVDRGGNVWAFDRCGGDTCAGSKLAPILKFDSSGRLVNSFGAGMFIFPHGFSVDKDGNVWATDGQGKDGKGQQVVKFSPDGKVLDQWKQFGRPSGIFIDAHDTIYVTDSQSDEKTNPGFQRGIRIGNATDGSVKSLIPSPGPAQKPTPEAIAAYPAGDPRLEVLLRGATTEGIAADASGNVYGGEANSMNLRKYAKN